MTTSKILARISRTQGYAWFSRLCPKGTQNHLAKPFGAVIAVLLAGGFGLSAQTAQFAGAVTEIGSGLSAPTGIAVDASGNVFYTTGSTDHALYEMSPSATSPTGYGTPSTISTSFTAPAGVAVDSSGDVYVADYGANSITEWQPAGGGSWTQNTSFSINFTPSAPTAVAVDAAGDVFVGDYGDGKVQEDQVGNATAVLVATVTHAAGIVLDASGNLYVTDDNSPGGLYEIPYAGGGSYNTKQSIGGSFGYAYPQGVAVDSTGNVYFDQGSGDATLGIIPAPALTTVEALTTGFSNANGMAVDAHGNLFVADQTAGVIDKIALQGVNLGSVSVGGTPATATLQFAFDTTETIKAPVVVTQGAASQDFTDADTGTCTTNGSSHNYAQYDTCTVVVSFNPTVSGARYGAVELLNTSGTLLATAYVYGTGTGPQITFNPGATQPPITGFTTPDDVAVDAAGNLFVADSHGAIDEIAAGTSTLTPLATGTTFTTPTGIAVDGAGNLLVTDSAGVQEIAAAGGYATVTTLGSGFSAPEGIAVDSFGNVYVADTGNNAVKELLAAGGYTTTVTLGSGFTSPSGVAVDASGNVYVAGNGSASEIVAVNGLIPASPTINSLGSGFSAPYGVGVDGNGNVYVTDTGSNAAYEIPAGSSTPILLASNLSTPAGLAVAGNGSVYIANSGSTQVTELDLADAPTLTFPSTGFNTTSSAQSVTVQNIGNLGLQMTGLAPSGDYAQISGSGTPADCSSSTLLAPGTNPTCNISVTFTPQVIGTDNGAVQLTDNTLNNTGSTQTITLDGTGGQASQTITFTGLPATATFGSAGPYTLNGTASSNLAVTYSVTGPATISGTTLTITGAGSVQVTASQAGDTNYSAATPVVQTIVVSAESQTITFTGLPATATFGSAGPYTLNGTASSNLAVTYSVTGPATISGTTLTITGAGSVQVTASQAGDTNYSAATPVVQTIVVSAESQTITFTGLPATATFGSAGPYTLNGTASSNLAVTYSVTGPATISGTTLTITGAGSVQVTASQAGDTNYSAATPVVQTIVVSPENQTITFTGLPATATFGSAGPYTLNGTASSNLAVTYSVTGPATISGTTLTITGAGSVQVTASQAGDTNYSAATPVVQTIVVSPENQTITFTGLPATATFGSAGPYTLNGTASSNLAVTYSVTGPATISGTTLTITGAGSVQVTASQAGNTNYNAATPVVQTIVVSPENQTITFTGLPATATFGSAGPYTLNGTASSNLAVTYSVTGPATISGTTLTITGAGSVQVTASQAGNTNYNAATPVVQTIVVSPENQTITFTGLPATATFGSAGPYTLNGTASSNLAVTYSVTGPATISGTTLTITGAGSVQVTASQAGNTNYNAATPVVQTIVVSPENQTITFTGLPATATFGSAGPYTLNGTASSNLAVTYSVTGPASISGTVLTITGAGTVVVTASQAGNANYSAATPVSQTIVVSAGSQTITFTGLPATATFGSAGPYTLNGTASSSLAVTYSVTGPASISGTVLTITGAGTVVVTASQAGNANYSAATPVSQTIVVSAGSQTITFTGLPATATFGSAGPYTLNGTASSSLAVTYSVTGPASISGTVLTITGAGTVVVTASQAGNANYSAATPVSQTIVVSGGSQTITFTGLPATATFGSAGPYTLNGTASSSLAVTYSVTGPASISGTVLTITGAGTVVVTASQAGNANYSAATPVSQTIVVSGGSQTITFTGLPATATFGSAGPYTLNGTASSSLAVTYSVTGPASISGSVLTITGAGTVVVTASQAGNANYSAATPVSQTILVSGGSQTITFTGLPATATFGSAGPYTLNGTASSSLAVTYSVTGPASISGSVLTITGAGTVVVTASQAGNANYSAATPVSQTILVSGGSQTITFTGLPATATFGSAGPYTLNGTASSNLAVTYSVTGPGSISGSVLTITGAGTVVVTASQAGNANYSAATPVSQTIVVSGASLTVSANNATRVYGAANPTFTGTITGAVNGNTFTESYTTTATASSNVGTYSIIPSASGTYLSDYTVTVDNGTLTVTQAGTNTTVSASASSVNPGSSVTLSATVVSQTTGTPTGSVAFYDGTTELGTGALTNGSAQLSVSSLPAGQNSITATYSGDTNFLTSSSTLTTPITVSSEDFTFSATGNVAPAVNPGGSASYTFALAPLYNAYPGTVTFSVTGLPAGASYTTSISSVASTAGPQNITVTVQTAANTARNELRNAGGRYATLALALLLPLFGFRRVRMSGRKLSKTVSLLILMAAGGLALSMMTGCGSSSGFNGNGSSQLYNITVSASSGSIQHSAAVRLEVQ